MDAAVKPAVRKDLVPAAHYISRDIARLEVEHLWPRVWQLACREEEIPNVGDFVTMGQRLGNVVPLDDVFIDANYKETQLKRIRPGQPVNISVDAYGHRKFAGIVDSISPAAGSVFTLLPPDNATGNFTKIVQRLPVRIRVPKDVAKQNLLRAGMSVYVTVDTREGAADADSEADLDAPGMVQPQ